MSESIERVVDALHDIVDTLEVIASNMQPTSPPDAPDGQTGMDVRIWIPFGNRDEVRKAVEDAKAHLDQVENIAAEYEES